MKPKAFFFIFVFSMANGLTALWAADSLSLSQAVQQAVENNYDVCISRLDTKTADVMNSWGAAGALPSLAFSLSGTRTRDFETELETDRTAGGLTLNWILFDGFGMFIQKSRLNELEKLSAGNTALLIEQTVQSVILAYYNALLQEKTAQVMDTLRLLSKDRYERAESQRQLGAIVTYDLLQAKNAWLEDEALFLQQQSRARNALRDLNYLMGITEDNLLHLTDSFEIEKKVYPYQAMLQKLKSDNQMLRNRYIQQTLLDKEAALTKSRWAPSISMRAGIDKTRLQGEQVAITDTYNGYGTLSLNWNLFTGGERIRASQAARINQEAGKIETQAMLHTLTNRLASALETYNVRKQLLDVSRESLETAALNLKISKEKFKSGAINSFNYRDVQLLYLNAAVSKLQSIYHLMESETELLRLTGGILSSLEAR